MVAYSFRYRFIAPIEAGIKRQTIRAPRKRHAKPGDPLHIYTAMRTKQCRLIGMAVCASIQPIRLSIAPKRFGTVEIEDRIVSKIAELNVFARADGFEDWWDMRLFWLAEHGPKSEAWSGVLIRWTSIDGR
jgi:hypothetical protein